MGLLVTVTQFHQLTPKLHVHTKAVTLFSKVYENGLDNIMVKGETIMSNFTFCHNVLNLTQIIFSIPYFLLNVFRFVGLLYVGKV